MFDVLGLGHEKPDGSWKLLTRVVCLFLLLFGCSSTHEKTGRNLSFEAVDFSSLSEDSSAILVFTIDCRVEQATDFLLKTLDWIKRNNVSVEVTCVPLTTACKDFPPQVRVISRTSPIGDVYAKSKHQVFFYSKEMKLLSQYPLWTDPKPLTDELRLYFAKTENAERNQLKNRQLTAKDVYSLTEKIVRSTKKPAVIAVFGELCFSCGSGIRLLALERLSQGYPNYAFSAILISNQSDTDLSRIKKNYHLRTELLTLPKDACSRRLMDTPEAGTGLKTPMEGLFLISDSAGRIVMQTRSIETLKSFLAKRKGGAM